MKRYLVVVVAAVLAATGAFAIAPGETELEHNGWFRYTNKSASFGITDPDVSAFSLARGYVRLKHKWAPKFETKLTVDIHSSDKYADGATVRLKEAYLSFALPVKDVKFTAGLQKHYWSNIYSWKYVNPFKALADAQKLVASADYGLTLNGYLPAGLGECQVGVYNGEGYKKTGGGVDVSPALVGNVRVAPFAGVKVGVSARYNAEKVHSDTESDKGVLGIAPMLKLALGPVTVEGEYLIWNFDNEVTDTTGAVTTTAVEQNGFSVVPVLTLAKRRWEVQGRFDMWSFSKDGASVDSKSLMRYGGGVNYHFLRRGKGKPGVALQLGWLRTQKQDDSDPKDEIMAQFRFEWKTVIPRVGG